MNAWFLDELDALTSSEYCIMVTPDNSSSPTSVKNDPTIRTVHGETYTTATDETFLKQRH